MGGHTILVPGKNIPVLLPTAFQRGKVICGTGSRMAGENDRGWRWAPFIGAVVGGAAFIWIMRRLVGGCSRPPRAVGSVPAAAAPDPRRPRLAQPALRAFLDDFLAASR